MSAATLLDNLVAHWWQVSFLVGTGAVLPFVLRLRRPRPMLRYWQGLFGITLLLPVLQPWHPQPPPADLVAFSSVGVVPAIAAESGVEPSFAELVLCVMLIGVVVRFSLLGVGLRRLRRYRHDSVAVPSAVLESLSVSSASAGVGIRLADQIVSAVTYGLLRPIVLLPRTFLEMPVGGQQAVIEHELLHVRRRDWLAALCEECVRAILWFHPGIWWLVARVRLAREQVVDEAVVGTEDPRRYVEALLASAVPTVPGVTGAPSFFTKSHLSSRVALLTQEDPMSKKRFNVLISIASCFVLLCCLAVTSQFPLRAAPEEEPNRISVTEANAHAIRKVPPRYPEHAKTKGIQGTVAVEIRINRQGEVEDAKVLSGPMELRKASLVAVLNWKYSTELELPALCNVDVNYSLTP